MTAPAEDADVEWMNRTLEVRSPRITIHPTDQPPPEDDSQEPAKAGADIEIDWGVLDKS
jgi:hypothetical protein